MKDRNALKAFYEERKASFSVSLAAVKKQINTISNLRIASVVAFGVLIYFAWTNAILFYGLIPLVVIFAWLVVKHISLFEKKVHLENLVEVNAREIRAAERNFEKFPAGSEFIDPHHPYSHDLDIFGEGSLFQALNRCNTFHGKRKFAAALSVALPDKKSILQQQDAIRELSWKTDFRQHIAAAGHEIDEQTGDRNELLTWLQQPVFVYSNSFFKYALVAFPLLTVAAVIGAFFSPVIKTIAVVLAITQWSILGVYLKRINAFAEIIGRKKGILEKYARLLFYLQHEKFSSTTMSEISRSAQDADEKLKKLASLVGAFNARSNMLMTVLVNSTLMYDFQYVYRLEQWKEENADNLRGWLDAVSDTEVLSSWGTYAFNHQHFIYATVGDGLNFEAKGMGHPLIPAEECVTNSVDAGVNSSILIITGANMAGKSTFLRTIGINVVLALSGAPVFAEKFSCPIILLRTGMRTADSLKDHQSYFYAELNRLKSIVDQLRMKLPLMILLDEILKGTNSTDKQAGSIALVRQLLPYPCLALIATHDLALGDLAEEFPQRVRNFCFEPNIENDQLSFDYKLKPGLAQKMNATFLMKKMGIIPS